MGVQIKEKPGNIKGYLRGVFFEQESIKEVID